MSIELNQTYDFVVFREYLGKQLEKEQSTTKQAGAKAWTVFRHRATLHVFVLVTTYVKVMQKL